METQYKTIFLQNGLAMLSDYQFRAVKCLLASALRLTPNMQEDYDRIQITTRMFARFPGAICVMQLIEAIKGDRELEGLVKSLKEQLGKVRKRFAEGAAAAPKRKKQVPRVGPSASECSSSGPAEAQRAAEPTRAQEENTWAQEQSELHRSTAYGAPKDPPAAAGAQPCTPRNPPSPTFAPDPSSAATAQAKRRRRSQSSALPETSAANLTPTPVQNPQKPLSICGQTEGPRSAPQAARTPLEAALLHPPPPAPAAASSSPSTQSTPVTHHSPAQSSASTRQTGSGPPSSSQRSSSAQVPRTGPHSSVQSSSTPQKPHSAPPSSSKSSSSTQVPRLGDPSSARSMTSTQLLCPHPPSSAGSTILIPLPNPGPLSSAGSTIFIPLPNPGPPSSAGSTIFIPLPNPGPHSPTGSTNLIQLPHPGTPSSVGSTTLAKVPCPGPPSSAGIATSAQVPCPGPTLTAINTTLAQVLHSGPPSSTRRMTSAQVPCPGHASSAGSKTSAQVPGPGLPSTARSKTSAKIQYPGPLSSAGSMTSSEVPRPGPSSSTGRSTSAQSASRLVGTFQEEGQQDQHKEMQVLDVTEPFRYREDRTMFHAIVAIKNQTQNQIVRVKVFHEGFKTNFLLGNILVLSNYIGHRGFVEVYKCTSVEKVGYKEVPEWLINMVTETPKISHLRQEAPNTVVNGVFLVSKKVVRHPCVYYEVQDETGTMQVVVYGHLTGIPCERGNRIRLICFERGEEQHQIRSSNHSFLKVVI